VYVLIGKSLLQNNIQLQSFGFGTHSFYVCAVRGVFSLNNGFKKRDGDYSLFRFIVRILLFWPKFERSVGWNKIAGVTPIVGHNTHILFGNRRHSTPFSNPETEGLVLLCVMVKRSKQNCVCVCFYCVGLFF